MDGIRTVVTENSVWKFDTTLSRYIRFPRHEAPDPGTIIPYTADWDTYIALERHGDRIIANAEFEGIAEGIEHVFRKAGCRFDDADRPRCRTTSRAHHALGIG
jgi:hypothetical protein